jgi:prepilin-type N-terminal cleavage/methylation domain-containing protein
MSTLKKHGFTLIEVMIALVILIIGIIGTSSFFYINRKNLYNARIERYATWKAVERMEWVKGLSDIASALPEGEPLVEYDISLGDEESAERKTERTQVDDNGVTYDEITITVSWDEDKNVSINTYISN